jgi:catechol 2,3-dioxygenase-like lactoylglutathione lyase family enzyme
VTTECVDRREAAATTLVRYLAIENCCAWHRDGGIMRVLNICRSAAAAMSTMLALGSLSNNALAQSATTQPGKGNVLGTGAVTTFVENMDRTLAFYHDAFGMDVPALPDSGARPYNPSNAQLYAMFDIAGAKERHQSARLADTDVRLEVMEVQNVPHSTIPLRVQDPGSLTLVFVVRDAARVLEHARKAHAEVATPGGKVVKLADGGESVLIKDSDGRLIELRQPATASADAKGGDITAMRLSVAVDDMAKTLHVYRDVLGFTVESDQNLGGDAKLRALTGLKKAEFRRSVVRGPGTSLPIEFVEYGGVDRKPLMMKIQDRGAARMQVRADDVEALVAKMRDAGLHVVSKGGGPVPIPPNFMGALVADPNNFFLTAIAPCDGCAPRLVSESH